MRGFALLLLTSAALAPAQPDIVPDIVRFEKAWTPFLFKLVGCPVNRPFTPPCKEPSEFDYALFLKSRKAAAKLFDLKEQ